MEPTVILILFSILVFIGILGSLLPVIPGTTLIFLAAAGYHFLGEPLQNSTLFWLAGLLAFSFLVEFLASMIGSGKLGASRAGIVAAVPGAIIGLLFLGPIGLFLGAFIATWLVELFQNRSMNEAIRAGFGSMIGVLAGTLMKFFLALAMAILFWIDAVRSLP